MSTGNEKSLLPSKLCRNFLHACPYLITSSLFPISKFLIIVSFSSLISSFPSSSSIITTPWCALCPFNTQATGNVSGNILPFTSWVTHMAVSIVAPPMSHVIPHLPAGTCKWSTKNSQLAADSKRSTTTLDPGRRGTKASRAISWHSSLSLELQQLGTVRYYVPFRSRLVIVERCLLKNSCSKSLPKSLR